MSKYIIFDFDGTIVNSMELALKLYNELAEKYNVKKLHAEELSLFKKLTIHERIKMVGVPLYLIPKLILEFKRNYLNHIDSLHEIEGMKDIILKLKSKGFQLGIISSNAVPNIKLFLNRIDLEVFDHIYSSKGIFGKHSTIQTVSRKLKIQKENMIYVGDESRDIDACKKANIEIIAVTWGFDSADFLAAGNPDFIADSPNELFTILDKFTVQE